MDSSSHETLEVVASSVEQAYGRLEALVPGLLQELEGSHGVHSSQSPGHTEANILASTLASMLALSENHVETALASHEEVERLLEGLGEQVTALAQLGTSVGAIREDSVLMELISLNAMVIAVKAGESGRAFSTITTELKGLSNDTLGLTDQIARHEATLGTAFSSFREDLHEHRLRAEAHLAAFRSSLRVVLQRLEASAQFLVEGLKQLAQRSEVVRSTLVRAGEARTNLAQLRHALDRSSHEGTDKTQLRAGLEQVAGLIRADRDRCLSSLREAKEHVESLEAAREVLLDQYLGAARESGLEHRFATGEAELGAFAATSADLSHQREAAFRKRLPLQKSVAGLVQLLRAFDALLAKFRNIDLASRVQVARHKALGPMRDNASEMSLLTRRIETDVGTAIRITSSFYQKVQALLRTYGEQFAAQLRLGQTYVHQMKGGLQTLREDKSRLSRAVQDSRLFTYSFLEALGRSEAQLEQLDTLLDQITKHVAALGIQE